MTLKELTKLYPLDTQIYVYNELLQETVELKTEHIEDLGNNSILIGTPL